MNRGLALVVGLAALIVAFVLAARSSSQDTAPRPEAALVMATALHQKPSATPTDTATPTVTLTPSPTPTALHLNRSQPSEQEILEFLFQYPQQGSLITPSAGAAVDRVRVPNESLDAMIVTGIGTDANYLGRSAPIAFGAVLLWVNEEYVVAFKHVEVGGSDARVIAWTSPGESQIWFMFQEIEAGSNRTLRRTYVLSCAFGQCRVIDISTGHSA